MSTNLYWIAVALVTVLSASRLTRFAVVDDFPPVKYFRDKIYNGLEGSGWQAITWCGFCASFWFTFLVVGWADVSGVFDAHIGHLPLWAQAWWFFNGTLAASYLAATYITRDGDDS